MLRRVDRGVGEVEGLDHTRLGFFRMIVAVAWVMRKRDGVGLRRSIPDVGHAENNIWSGVSGLRTGGAAGYCVEKRCCCRR